MYQCEEIIQLFFFIFQYFVYQEVDCLYFVGFFIDYGDVGIVYELFDVGFDYIVMFVEDLQCMVGVLEFLVGQEGFDDWCDEFQLFMMMVVLGCIWIMFGQIQ